MVNENFLLATLFGGLISQARGPGLELEDILTVIFKSTAMPNLLFGRVSMRTTSARYSELMGSFAEYGKVTKTRMPL